MMTSSKFVKQREKRGDAFFSGKIRGHKLFPKLYLGKPLVCIMTFIKIFA